MLKHFALLTLIAGAAASQPLPVAGELPRAIAGEAYSAKLTPVVSARCPDGDVSWSLTSGSLPEGLRLDATGLRGIPLHAGVYEFVLRESNPCATASIATKLVVGGKPVLNVSSEVLEFEVEAGQAGTQSVLVSSDWMQLPYTVSVAGADWLTFEPATGKTPTQGSADPVAIRVDAGKLSPGAYEAVLRVSAWRGANVPVVRVKVKVVDKRS